MFLSRRLGHSGERECRLLEAIQRRAPLPTPSRLLDYRSFVFDSSACVRHLECDDEISDNYLGFYTAVKFEVRIVGLRAEFSADVLENVFIDSRLFNGLKRIIVGEEFLKERLV